MKKTLLVIIALLPSLLFAQEAALTTPNTRASETKVKILSFNISNPPGGTAGGSIELSVQDASNNHIRVIAVPVPCTSPACTVCSTSLTINSLTGAMNVTRVGETSPNARIQQFRVIGHLFDQGCLTGFQSPSP